MISHGDPYIRTRIKWRVALLPALGVAADGGHVPRRGLRHPAGGSLLDALPRPHLWPRVFLFGATVILSETRNVLAGIVLAVAIAVILIDDF